MWVELSVPVVPRARMMKPDSASISQMVVRERAAPLEGSCGIWGTTKRIRSINGPVYREQAIRIDAFAETAVPLDRVPGRWRFRTPAGLRNSRLLSPAVPLGRPSRVGIRLVLGR